MEEIIGADRQRSGTGETGENTPSAESAVISCLLNNIRVMEKIHDSLSSEMFEEPLLGEVYAFFVDCYENNKPADYITTMDAVGNDGNKTLLNIMLARCVRMDVMSYDVKYYADVVINDYMGRRFYQVLKDAKETEGGFSEKINKAIKGLEAIDQSESDESEEVAESVDKYSGNKFTENAEQGIKIGFKGIDRLTQGLSRGDMCIIAARPAVGKSAFATDICLKMAQNGYRVGLYNLEMKNEQIYDRMVANISGIELSRVRRAQSFLHGEEKLFDDANKRLKELSICLCDKLRTVSKIKAHAKRKGIQVAIIDYAQLLRPESHYRGNRTAEVGQISHSVKEAAQKLDIPIILLAQLNRASLMTKDKEPTMGELRESGDFEQDADIVMLLWNKGDDKRKKGLKVDKARQGEPGRIELDFDGAVMRFSEEADMGDSEPNPFEL